MSLFLVAGEASGDHYGRRLIEEIRALRPDTRFRGLGREGMIAAGLECLSPMGGLSVMFFREVFRQLARFRQLFRDTVADLRRSPPDLLVLIDYPGFNVRLARRARRLGIPVLYYVSPQVWAWAGWRARRIARVVDRLLTILPFEAGIYAPLGVQVDYVGHPIVDRLAALPPASPMPPGPPLVGLLPGSRHQELRQLAPLMLRAAAQLHRRWPQGLRFAMPLAEQGQLAEVRALPEAAGLPLALTAGNAPDVMRQARFCLASSGTATLELAWFGTPFLLLYRASPLGYLGGQLVLRSRHIGLVNILAGEEAAPEFFLYDERLPVVVEEAWRLLADDAWRETCKEKLGRVRRLIGEPGASARAAAIAVAMAERRRA